MDIIAARRFAPDYLFGLGFELRKADGAVAVDSFAFARVVVVVARLVFGVRGGVLEDVAEFLILVSEGQNILERRGWRTAEMSGSWYC